MTRVAPTATLLFSAVIMMLLSIMTTPTSAFQMMTPNQQGSTSLAMFGDAFKNAFSNEEMGKRQNEGLSNGPNYNENVSVNGKPVKGAVVGQKITVVAGRARVKIPVNCQKGDCGTCVVKVNGRNVKACQTALGAGKTTIQTQ